MPLTETERMGTETKVAETEAEHQPYRAPANEPVRTQLEELFAQLEDISTPSPGRRVSLGQKRVIATIIGLLEEYGHGLRELADRIKPSGGRIHNSLKVAGTQLSEVEAAALEQLKGRMVPVVPGSRRQFSEQNEREAIAALRLLRKQRADIGALRKAYGLSYILTPVWEKKYANTPTCELVPDVFPQPQSEQVPVKAVHEAATTVADQSSLATVPERQLTPAETPDTIIKTLREQVTALTEIVSAMMGQNEMVMQAFAQRAGTEQRRELPAVPRAEVVESAPSRPIQATLSQNGSRTEVSFTVDGRRIDVSSNASFLLFPLFNGNALGHQQ